MTPDAFAAAANVSRETMERLHAYEAVLRRWHTRMNLVGRATLADPWRRHFLDSAQLVPLLPAGTQTITDLGSGAGFPGMVLAILTACETILVEADARKSAFLREAARQTAATVRIVTGRIEALDPWPTDIVTARALAPLPRLLEYATRFPPRTVQTGTTFLFLKGATLEEELTRTQISWHMRIEFCRSISSPDGCVLRIQGAEKRNI